jgi:hypothetical protein
MADVHDRTHGGVALGHLVGEYLAIGSARCVRTVLTAFGVVTEELLQFSSRAEWSITEAVRPHRFPFMAKAAGIVS